MWLLLKRTALLLVVASASHAVPVDSSSINPPRFDSLGINLDAFERMSHLHEVVLRMRDGRQEEANLMIARILARTPQDKDALELAGISLMITQQFEAAEEAFARRVALPPVSAEIVSKYGVTKILNGDTEGGVRLLRQVIQYRPNDEMSNRYLGWLEDRDNNPALAIEYLRRLPTPEQVSLRDYHIDLAKNYKNVGAYQAIIDLLAAAVSPRELNGENLRIQAALYLALAHAGLGDSSRSQTWLSSLKPYMEENPVGRFQLEMNLAEVTKNTTAARKAVDDFLEEKKDGEDFARFELAKVLLAQGETIQAVDQIQLALEHANEENTRHILSLLIPVLTGENLINDAIGSLENASTKFPKNDEFRFGLADMQATHGRVESANETLRTLRDRRSPYPPAVLLTARLARAQQNYSLALDYLEQYIEEMPGDSNGWIAKAGVYYDQNQIDLAIDTLKQGAASNPGEAVLQYELGAMYQAAGRIESANDRYEQALALNANHVQAMDSLASNLLDMDEDIERAYEFAEKLYSYMTDDPYIKDLWGWALYRKGELESAQAVLETAAAGIQDSGRADYHLALTLRDLGEEDEAVEYFRSALGKGLDDHLKPTAERAIQGP